MVKIIIVTEHRDRFASLVEGLQSESDCTVGWIDSQEEAQSTVSSSPPDVMIVDEKVGVVSNLELAHGLVMANPMVHLALVSSLSHNDFHEASEGLGVLVQLAPGCGKNDASKLVEAFRRVTSFMNPA